MQRPGKNKSARKKSPNENKVENARSFGVISGIIGIIVLLIYLVATAYPSRLFSEVKENEIAEQQAVPVAVHPAVPDSPLKTQTTELFDNTNELWKKLFSKAGKKYIAPRIQFFEDTISAYECGLVLPGTGSFYCRADQETYIDLSYFSTLSKRFPSSANRVQAYIMAHQAGHHIEELLGINAKVEAARATLSDADYKKLTSKQEILADYYAGVWFHYNWKEDFDHGDAELAISFATQISIALAQNNDTMDAYSYVNIGNRSDWFYKGYISGNLKDAEGLFAEGELP